MTFYREENEGKRLRWWRRGTVMVAVARGRCSGGLRELTSSRKEGDAPIYRLELEKVFARKKKFRWPAPDSAVAPVRGGGRKIQREKERIEGVCVCY